MSQRNKKPWRLTLAQLTRPLPPIVARYPLRLIYSRRLGRFDGYTFNVRAQTGSRFIGVTGDFHAHRFAAHGYSEWRLWAVAAALCSAGDLIVEVGANVGTETVGYSDIVGPTGKVAAFEPMPANVHALERLARLSSHQNIVLFPFALAEDAGTARFAVPPPEESAGTGHILGPGERKNGVQYYGRHVAADVIEVECQTLDAFLDSFDRIALIACDAEGSDLAIVRGAKTAINRDRPTLVVEASPPHLERAGASVQDLFAEIARLDYSISEIGRLSLLRVNAKDPRPRGTWNWLCLPSERREDARRVDGYLRRCGLLPCVRGVNPLVRPRRDRRTSHDATASARS